MGGSLAIVQQRRNEQLYPGAFIIKIIRRLFCLWQGGI